MIVNIGVTIITTITVIIIIFPTRNTLDVWAIGSAEGATMKVIITVIISSVGKYVYVSRVPLGSTFGRLSLRGLGGAFTAELVNRSLVCGGFRLVYFWLFALMSGAETLFWTHDIREGLQICLCGAGGSARQPLKLLEKSDMHVGCN